MFKTTVMKKLLTTITCLFVAMCSTAQIKEVQLTDPTGKEASKDNRNLAPAVKYDEHFVYLSSRTLIPNAQVTIKDGADNVLFRQTLSIYPAANAIDLPDKGKDKRVITISYDKTALIGFFDEE